MLAPAKVNLALHVTGRRDDGYHLLDSLVVFTRFGDRIEAQLSECDGFEVSGRYAGEVPQTADNLVLKARDALRARLGRAADAPVRILLEKNLPVASGIGGGSSDAAAVLNALAVLWKTELGHDDLDAIALALGADVPMCRVAKPLMARGVGERLEPLPGLPALALVLVNPGVPVSTARVFAELGSPANAPLPSLPGRFDFHTLRNWLDTTRNDLEAPARRIEPSIGAALAALDKAGSGFSRMSGSGGTCYGLFETNNVAKRAAAAIRGRYPEWFVAATRSIASEAGE